MKTSPSEPTMISIPELKIANPRLSDSELDREREAEERARNIEKSRVLWSEAKVPARHGDFLKTLPTSGPWADANTELMNLIGSGFICVLLGNRGTGKTQMAVKAIHESCRLQRPASYVKAMQIFLDIRDSFGTERSEKASVARYTAPSLLVIDAMEERGETSFEDRILNHIIDVRYDSLKDTILVTNQTPDAFSQSAGPSIVSRIHETGKRIECNWPSFRSPPMSNRTAVA